jgi:hypothetical protein
MNTMTLLHFAAKYQHYARKQGAAVEITLHKKDHKILFSDVNFKSLAPESIKSEKLHVITV